MLKYCVDQWEKNKENLREAIEGFKYYKENMSYKALMSLIITHILEDEWDSENFTTIDDGDYQGTLLFVIPKRCYQPNACSYLMTYVEYGSCSCCDTMLAILGSKTMVDDLMTLALHMVQRMVRPFGGEMDE